MDTKSATVHASAVLAGPRAILIRGPAGAGKSRLALAVIQAAQCGIVAQLEALRSQMGPREYVVVVDLLGRWLDAERERLEFSLRRWAA